MISATQTPKACKLICCTTLQFLDTCSHASQEQPRGCCCTALQRMYSAASNTVSRLPGDQAPLNVPDERSGHEGAVKRNPNRLAVAQNGPSQWQTDEDSDLSQVSAESLPMQQQQQLEQDAQDDEQVNEQGQQVGENRSKWQHLELAAISRTSAQVYSSMNAADRQQSRPTHASQLVFQALSNHDKYAILARHYLITVMARIKTLWKHARYDHGIIAWLRAAGAKPDRQFVVSYKIIVADPLLFSS